MWVHVSLSYCGKLKFTSVWVSFELHFTAPFSNKRDDYDCSFFVVALTLNSCAIHEADTIDESLPLLHHRRGEL